MGFVAYAGRIRNVFQPPGAWSWGPAPNNRLTLAAGVYPTYEQIYRTQPAVRTVVGFIARNVAQLGLDVYRRAGDDDREKVAGHPLNQLLRRPRRKSGWTKYGLLSWTLHELCIYDNAYWLKVKTDGELGLWPVPNRFIKPDGDDWTAPERYVVEGGKSRQTFKADQVVHFHGYNPEDMRLGTSPMETLRQVLAEEHAANTWREQMWRNGARVSGYIERPKDAPEWDRSQRDRFRRSWQAQYTGSGPATGGTPILEDGMKFVASGVSPRDAQYIEARLLTRKEVAQTYYLNPLMLGLMDQGVSNANLQVIHRMLYQDSLGPVLTQISQQIECQLLEDVDPSAIGGGLYVEFNLAEKLRGSFEEQAHALQTLVGGPVMTRAEGRARLNLPHKEGTDDLIVPMNVTKGGLASPNDTAPDDPSNEASNGELPKGLDYDAWLQLELSEQKKAVTP